MHDDIRLGATGRFPEGKLRADDEGELRAAIGTMKGQVVIDFGKPVSWLSLPPEQAKALALVLLKKAAVASGKPMVIDLGGDDPGQRPRGRG
jgi:hypothetical protein